MTLPENQPALRIASESMAHWFHDAYEELAPQFDYETRTETAIPWDDIPVDNPNKQLMIAVCAKFLSENAVYNGDSDGEAGNTGGDAYMTFQGG